MTMGAVALALGVSSGRSTAQGSAPEPAIGPAVDRAARFLEAAAKNEPYGLAFGYFLHRRFGLPRFGDAPRRYDALTAAAPTDQGKHRGRPRPGALRLFRRLVAPDAMFEPADLPAAEGPLDEVTVPALYCDRVPTPPDYARRLRTEAAAGGYHLTHAALALAWLGDNGCAVPLSPDDRTAWMAGLADLVRARPLHDVGFEAAALLAYLGHRHRLPAAYVRHILEAQEPDGGWRPCPAPPCDPPTGLRPEAPASHWHPTALALWALLEATAASPADRFVPGTGTLPAPARR